VRLGDRGEGEQQTLLFFRSRRQVMIGGGTLRGGSPGTFPQKGTLFFGFVRRGKEKLERNGVGGER